MPQKSKGVGYQHWMLYLPKGKTLNALKKWEEHGVTLIKKSMFNAVFSCSIW